MGNYFEKNVDRRSRNAMVGFLTGYYRYFTAKPWNRSSSFANVVKVDRLGLTPEQLQTAYEVIEAENCWDRISDPINEFTKANSHRYTICSDGRSSGYLVLHESNLRPTGELEISSRPIPHYDGYSPEEWTMANLRERVERVVQFDRACDQLSENFIWLLDPSKVVEEVHYEPVYKKSLAIIEG